VRTGRLVVRHFKPGSTDVERRALFSPTTLTGIIVPFFAGPDADGVLLIGEERARAQHLLPDRLAVFQQVAHDLGEVLMVAHTIEQRRVDRLEREKHLIKLNERRELARELHDDVGQALTGLLMQVRYAIEEKRADPAALRMFETGARNALEAARALAYELRRRSQGDPIDAAKGAVETLLASTGTRLTWSDVRSRDALSPKVAQELARAIREAVANIVRHARAENVYVEINGDSNRVVATVVDDGLGMTRSSSSTSRLRGLGLAARAEAIARVGGVLDVQQPVEGGTRVSIEVPGAA
jgi:two-component system, NarL family, sensor histidine kinase DesK